MKQAIIVHGMPSREECAESTENICSQHWLPWLKTELNQYGITAVTPEMPKPFDPAWATWAETMNRYDISAKTSLVGHSGGAGFLVRYLSEYPKLRAGKVVLVAPWLDPDKNETEGFFDFDLDPDMIARTDGITIFNSDNDMGNVHKSVAMLRQAIPGIRYREFNKYGHFTENDMGTKAFPALLHELVG